MSADLDKQTINTDIINFIIKKLDPSIYDTIYDPVMPSSSFLNEIIMFINKLHYNINWSQFPKTINGSTYSNIIESQVNMQLNKINTSTRFNNTIYSPMEEKYDVIMTHVTHKEVYYINHCINSMKIVSRCAIVIDQSFLINDTSEYIDVRKKLIENFSTRIMLILGTNLCIIFFNNTMHSTDKLYIYDLYENNGSLVVSYNMIINTKWLYENNYLFNNISQKMDDIPLSLIFDDNYV
jgi:hypothetical protein